MYQNYVTCLILVTRLTPFQFLGQPGIKTDRSQLLEFFTPLFGFPQKSINPGIHFIHLLITLKQRAENCRCRDYRRRSWRRRKVFVQENWVGIAIANATTIIIAKASAISRIPPDHPRTEPSRFVPRPLKNQPPKITRPSSSTTPSPIRSPTGALKSTT